MKRVVFVVAAALLTTTACASTSGSSGDEAKKSACIKLDRKALDGIAEGLTKKAEIARGFAVKIPSPETKLRYIAALEVKDATGTSTAMLAMGAPEEGGGPLVVADNYAELYLDWGADIKDGSPLKDAAKNAWLSDAGKEAAGCI